MSTLRVLCCDHPQRTIALATNEYALIFRHTPTPAESLNSTTYQINDTPRCMVEFSSLSSVDLRNYRHLADGHGTLGLITLNNDVFLCVVTVSSRAATVKPGETILRIDNVEFCMLPLPHIPSPGDLKTDQDSLHKPLRLRKRGGLRVGVPVRSRRAQLWYRL